MRVRVSTKVNLRFVHLWCISPFGRRYFSSNATGAQKTVPSINHGILKAMPIALPPLSEQNNLVAKVHELIALCEQLGLRDTLKSKLLEATLREALAS